MSEKMVEITVGEQGESADRRGELALSVHGKHLANFLVNLLGQPQTLERTFERIFEVDHEWLCNIHYLLLQRTQSQNDGVLLQFSAHLHFQDGIIRTVNSIESFKAFVEIQPILSTGCIMRWTFLLKFQDKDTPEKQEVDFSIHGTDPEKKTGPKANDDAPRFWSEILPTRPGTISLRIRYTERTWGDDILNVISGQIDSSTRKLGRLPSFLADNYKSFSLLIYTGSFIIATFLAATLSERITSYRGGKFLDSTKNMLFSESVSSKLYFLIVNGSEQSAVVVFPVFIATALATSLIFLVPYMLRLQESYVILTDRTRKYSIERMDKGRKRRNLVTTIVLGVTASLIATLIVGFVYGCLGIPSTLL